MENRKIYQILTILLISKIAYFVFGVATYVFDFFRILLLASMVIDLYCYGRLIRKQILYTYTLVLGIIIFLFQFLSDLNANVGTILLIYFVYPLITLSFHYCLVHSHGAIIKEINNKMKQNWYDLFYLYGAATLLTMISTNILVFFNISNTLLISILQFCTIIGSLCLLFAEILYTVYLYKTTTLLK